MKKYLYLLVPLILGTFAGNSKNLSDDKNLSYYVIKDCEIYTATEEDPTIPVKKIEAENYDIDNLLWKLSYCPPNNVIRGKEFISSLEEGDSHFEIVNTISKNEYVKKIGCEPDDNPITRTHNISYYDEEISDEVRDWRKKISQSRDLLRYKFYMSRTF